MDRTVTGAYAWRSDNGWRLWLRWVAANALGEALGLGMTALVGIGVFSALNGGVGVASTLALAALAVVAGTIIEGVVVGSMQWGVLRHPLPQLRWKTWAFATAAGAGAAWTLGMVPSTLLSLARPGTGSTQPTPTEPPAIVIYALAFLMGLVLGPILGFAQWLVLRRHVWRAFLWMPANAVAWAFGMVIIFVGTNAIPPEGMNGAVAALLFAALIGAGVVVGAIHGVVLLWLLRHRLPEASRTCVPELTRF